MPDLTVNNTTYPYPDANDPPGWGEPATGWAEEVTSVLDSLLASDDILQTSFTIANNQTSSANINGLAFSTSTVRSFIVKYSIYRVTATNELAESGTIYGVYKNNANTWEINVQSVGSGGVYFSITSAGQFQYTSTNVSGASYSGTMKFKAETLSQ
jgi:hypothetical protein